MRWKEKNMTLLINHERFKKEKRSTLSVAFCLHLFLTTAAVCTCKYLLYKGSGSLFFT